MEQTEFTIKEAVETVVEDAYYVVDFSKIESVNDLVLILASMGITFHNTHPHFKTVSRFLDMDHPIKPEQPSKIVPFKAPKKV